MTRDKLLEIINRGFYFFGTLAGRKPRPRKDRSLYRALLVRWYVKRQISNGYFALIKTLDIIVNWLASHYPTAYLFHNTILDERYKAQRLFEDKLENMVKKSRVPVASSNNEVQSEVVVYNFKLRHTISPKKVMALQTVMREKFSSVYVQGDAGNLRFIFPRFELVNFLNGEK